MLAPKANVNTKFSVLNAAGEFEDYSPDKLNPNAQTYFVTHGLTGTAAKGQKWQTEMVKSLERETFAVNLPENRPYAGANVIRVTWDAPLRSTIGKLFSSGSVTNYERAAANTETVGQNIVNVIRESGGNIKPESTTLIGHSLGAQVSGWAGSKAKNQDLGEISTIVGLDPARPSFETNVPVGSYISPHQLNAGDANRVVAIHTSKNFGINNPITGAEDTSNGNTLDVYVNGGSYFDGLTGIVDPVGTQSHGYAHTFFQNLLDGEGFDNNYNGGIAEIENESKLWSPSDPAAGNSPFLVSLNTILQGNENSSLDKLNRGIINVGVSSAPGTATLPETLEFNGTVLDDTLAGTKTGDRIEGFEGNDIITGLQGNDDLSGLEDNDSVYGGSGDDTVLGGRGNDFLSGNDGADTLSGVDANDNRPGAGEIDVLLGNANEDVFELGDTRDGTPRYYYSDFSGTKTKDYAVIRDFETKYDKIRIGPDVEIFDTGNSFSLRDGGAEQVTGAVIGMRTGGGYETYGVIEGIAPENLRRLNDEFVVGTNSVFLETS